MTGTHAAPAGQDVPAADDDALATALDPRNLGPRRLEHWAAVRPDHPFLVEAGCGRRALGYREVHERVLRWCVVLTRLGIGPGTRFGSALPPSVDAVCCWLAAGLLGAVEVAVDRDLRGEFLRHVLTDSGIRTCLVRPEDKARIGAAPPEIVPVEVDEEGTLLAGVPAEPRPARTVPDDVCCVIYTSGTTGPAKGVVISWAQMTALLGRVPHSWFGPDEVTYAPWPMFHVTGRSPVVTMLHTGGTVVLRERFTRTGFWPDVLRHGITHASLAPVAGLLARDVDAPAAGEHPLRIVLGSSDPGLLRFVERFGVRAVASYGSTEVGFVIVNRVFGPDTLGMMGWPRRGYRARVVDPTGADVAVGELGELLVRPPARELILREYLGRPELTAAATADGWYHTGDAVRARPDGGFEFVDRLRDTIRRFAENISSTAVEGVVTQLPEVLDAAVVGVPDEAAGQELLLVVVPVDGAAVDEPALVERLRDLLPRHALPRYVRVVPTLPKTPSGKVRKTGLHTLADGAWERQ